MEWDRAEKKAGGSVDFTSETADILYDDARKKCLRYVELAIHITDIFKQRYIHTLFVRFAKEKLGVDQEQD